MNADSRRPILFHAPTAPGWFRFRCEEVPGVEIVEVIQGEHGQLFCIMDGIRRTVNDWHSGLTRPRWQQFKEVGLLFSDELALACRKGSKTQTRRPASVPKDSSPFAKPGLYTPLRIDKHGMEYPAEETFGVWGEGWDCEAPARPGDRVWVRETWRETSTGERADLPGLPQFVFRADCPVPRAFKWKPSIHMHRTTARTLLPVVGIRFERAADISESDAVAEGFVLSHHEREAGRTHADLFRAWWGNQYGAGAEWCWVFDFKTRYA